MNVKRVPASFRGRKDPRKEQIREQANRWLQEMGLVSPKMLSTTFDELAYVDLAAGYSYGSTREGAQILSDLTSWLFVFDDQGDRCVAEFRIEDWWDLSAHLHSALQDLDLAQTDQYPVVRALADILKRISVHFSASWWDRFIRNWEGLLNGNDREFINRLSGKCESLEDYVLLRRRSIAMIMWMDLVELAAQTELPNSLYSTPEYQICINATIDYCAECNDLHSFAKENNADDTTNIVTVISRAGQCSLEEAAEETYRRMAAHLQDFVQAERDLCTTVADRLGLDTTLRQGLHRCLLSMRDWIANMDDWHRQSTRYSAVDTQTPLQAYNEDLFVGA